MSFELQALSMNKSHSPKADGSQLFLSILQTFIHIYVLLHCMFPTIINLHHSLSHPVKMFFIIVEKINSPVYRISNVANTCMIKTNSPTLVITHVNNSIYQTARASYYGYSTILHSIHLI